VSSTVQFVVCAAAALLAGVCLAATGVLQQRAARERPADERMSLRLVVNLAQSKWWLAGIGAAVLSYAFQAVALATGPLTLVQPLVVSELLFAIPVSTHLRGRKLTRRDWGAVLTVVVGLAIGIVAADPKRGDPLQPFSLWGWALLAVSAVVVGAVLTARMVKGPVKASMFALAGAVTMGTQSGLFNSTIAMLRQDIGGTFASWQPYALIVASFLGMYLVQNAYQAGPLAASMPVMDASLPLVSIGLGIGLFGDAIRTTWWGLAGAGVGIALLVVGIIGLDTSPNVRRQDEAEQGEAKEEGDGGDEGQADGQDRGNGGEGKRTASERSVGA
jgi:drug/metabolite transporter (DMT)-like permease